MMANLGEFLIITHFLDSMFYLEKSNKNYSKFAIFDERV